MPPQEDFPLVTFETWKELSPKAAALQAVCSPNGTGTAPPGSFVPPNNFRKEKRFAQQNCPGTSSTASSKKGSRKHAAIAKGEGEMHAAEPTCPVPSSAPESIGTAKLKTNPTPRSSDKLIPQTSLAPVLTASKPPP